MLAWKDCSFIVVVFADIVVICIGKISWKDHLRTLLRLFAVVDDIFCLFQGHIENVVLLKQHYGLSKTANEDIIVTEAYRSLRDQGPYPSDQVARDIAGKFAFMIFNSFSKTAFLVSIRC
ncbi:hypothetical protein NL676_029522 [Syzygium grande]|nr:hypothetical protein NL676_029522 [Syzygium grande]